MSGLKKIAWFFTCWIGTICGLYATVYAVRFFTFGFDIQAAIHFSNQDNAENTGALILVLGLITAIIMSRKN